MSIKKLKESSKPKTSNITQQKETGIIKKFSNKNTKSATTMPVKYKNTALSTHVLDTALTSHKVLSPIVKKEKIAVRNAINMAIRDTKNKALELIKKNFDEVVSQEKELKSSLIKQVTSLINDLVKQVAVETSVTVPEVTKDLESKDDKMTNGSLDKLSKNKLSSKTKTKKT